MTHEVEAGASIWPGEEVVLGRDGKAYPSPAAVQRRGSAEQVRHSLERVKESLTGQVAEMVRKCAALDDLAGGMLATVQLNVEKGNLVATSEEGGRTLKQLIDSWNQKLKTLRA